MWWLIQFLPILDSILDSILEVFSAMFVGGLENGIDKQLLGHF